MPDRAKQIVESLTYDGVLDWSSAGWVFVGLAALVGWLLWRERRITGTVTASFFFVLRLAAIALVLWMLLGPTFMTTERTTIPQTLAVVVDASQSMNVAEPLPPIDRLRWQQAVAADVQEHRELGITDAGMVALRFAVANLRQVVVAANEYLPADQVAKSLDVARKAASRASEYLGEVSRILQATDEELARQAAETASELEHDGLPAIDKLAAVWKTSAQSEASSLAEALLEDFQRQLRRAETVERGVIARLADLADSASDSGQVVPSRKELVTGALERLDEQVLSKLASTVNIKRVRVDEFAVPVPADKTWRAALEAAREPPAADPQANTARGSDIRDNDFRDSDSRQELNVGPATNLTAALDLLRQDAAAESIGAAVLYSDGGHNAPKAIEPQIAAAGLAGLPVHVVPVSSQEPQRDLVLYRVSAPTSVILNDKIVLEALVTGQYLSGEQATIELRRAGNLLETRKLEFNSDRQDHRLQFIVPANELGQQVFDFVAIPLSDEASAANNAAVAAVRVLRDTTRILLADRAARWEFRYLDQLYRRDKHVKCDKLLFAPQVMATGQLEADKQLPNDVEAWSNYDVVILGDLEPDTFDLPQQKSLEEWVRKRGGTVVVIAGNEFMPHGYRRGLLTELLPVQEALRMPPNRDGYVPAMTPEGARHEALMLADTQAASADLWARQFQSVPIYYLSSFCVPKPAAHVLLEAVSAGQFIAPPNDDDRAPERTLLAWQDVGAGRVVYLASPVTYHLRFRRGDELHHRFWGQMLRWLTATERGKGQSRLLVKTTESRYEFGKPIDVMVVLSNNDGSPIKGAELAALAESPTGVPSSVPLVPDESIPGRYYGKFDELLPGAYRISATGDVVSAIAADNEDSTALVTVFAPDNVEMNDTRGNRALLREVSEVTGGQVLAPTAVGEMLQLSALAPRVIEDSVRTPLWNRWRYFWVVVGCLATEWIVRRRIGLV